MNAVGNSSDENFLVLLNAQREDVGFTVPAFRPVQGTDADAATVHWQPVSKSLEC
jgi:hypothetical protein